MTDHCRPFRRINRNFQLCPFAICQVPPHRKIVLAQRHPPALFISRATSFLVCYVYFFGRRKQICGGNLLWYVTGYWCTLSYHSQKLSVQSYHSLFASSD